MVRWLANRQTARLEGASSRSVRSRRPGADGLGEGWDGTPVGVVPGVSALSPVAGAARPSRRAGPRGRDGPSRGSPSGRRARLRGRLTCRVLTGGSFPSAARSIRRSIIRTRPAAASRGGRPAAPPRVSGDLAFGTQGPPVQIQSP